MVNIIPEDQALSMGLVITEKRMNLKGVGGHHTGIIGIAENTEILIGNLPRKVHFWVARGPVQIILGKPFLLDVSANIKYQGKQESLAISDTKGQSYLVPISTPKHHKWETTLPSNLVTRNFLEDGVGNPKME